MNRRNMNTPEAVTATTDRPKRKAVGYRNVMTVEGKDPEYEYRFVNDEVGNVGMFQDNGWEVVHNSDTLKVGDRRVTDATPEGSIAQITADRRTGQKAILMRIRKEWFEEDQQAYARTVDESERALKPNIEDGGYGHITIERSRR